MAGSVDHHTAQTGMNLDGDMQAPLRSPTAPQTQAHDHLHATHTAGNIFGIQSSPASASTATLSSPTPAHFGQGTSTPSFGGEQLPSARARVDHAARTFGCHVASGTIPVSYFFRP